MNPRLTIAVAAAFTAAQIMFASELITDHALPDFVWPAVKSPIIDGFCVGFDGQHGTNNTTIDDWLVFLPWTTNNHTVWISVPVEPEYAYRIELLDTNGLTVPKTARGKRAGSRFDDFDAHPSKRGIAIKHLAAHKMDGVTDSPMLFRAADMFKIEKPGLYRLHIQFQILVFPRTGVGRGAYTNELIRFPPLDYPLIKAASPSTNAVNKRASSLYWLRERTTSPSRPPVREAIREAPTSAFKFSLLTHLAGIVFCLLWCAHCQNNQAGKAVLPFFVPIERTFARLLEVEGLVARDVSASRTNRHFTVNGRLWLWLLNSGAYMHCTWATPV